jgi:hypothetical protein
VLLLIDLERLLSAPAAGSDGRGEGVDGVADGGAVLGATNDLRERYLRLQRVRRTGEERKSDATAVLLHELRR